jgi:hypothetical protein
VHAQGAELQVVDEAVRKVADKLALYVAKNGRNFEDVTRNRNPGESPFMYDSPSDNTNSRK